MPKFAYLEVFTIDLLFFNESKEKLIVLVLFISLYECFWAGGEQIYPNLRVFVLDVFGLFVDKFSFTFASFSAYYFVLGLFLLVNNGIFTQRRAGGESKVHKQELQHMGATHADHFLVSVPTNIILNTDT